MVGSRVYLFDLQGLQASWGRRSSIGTLIIQNDTAVLVEAVSGTERALD